MYNCMTTSDIFRRNQKCREKIKSLYNKYNHRYDITYGDYYITINGISYGCKMIDEIEKALKCKDIRLDVQIRIR